MIMMRTEVSEKATQLAFGKVSQIGANFLIWGSKTALHSSQLLGSMFNRNSAIDHQKLIRLAKFGSMCPLSSSC